MVIVEHCSDRTHIELTPADLSYSDITIDELEGHLQVINRGQPSRPLPACPDAGGYAVQLADGA